MYKPNEIKSKDSRDLNHLHPDVKKLAEELIKDLNNSYPRYVFKVVSTLRSWEEQDALYAQGRTKPGIIVTNAKAGRSIHNLGCAFDIGIFKNGIYITEKSAKEDFDMYKKIGSHGKKIGLRWGGDFTKPKDYPHFEYTGKYTSNEFIDKFNSGVSIDDLLDPIGALIRTMNEGREIEEMIKKDLNNIIRR